MTDVTFTFRVERVLKEAFAEMAAERICPLRSCLAG